MIATLKTLTTFWTSKNASSSGLRGKFGELLFKCRKHPRQEIHWLPPWKFDHFKKESTSVPVPSFFMTFREGLTFIRLNKTPTNPLQFYKLQKIHRNVIPYLTLSTSTLFGGLSTKKHHHATQISRRKNTWWWMSWDWIWSFQQNPPEPGDSSRDLFIPYLEVSHKNSPSQKGHENAELPGS